MRIHEEVRKMPVSPIRTWTSRLHDLSPRAELTLGEPPQITDSRIIEAAKTALDQGLTHYPPAAGLQSLRQELAKRERQLRGWTIHPHQVLVTNGAQEALAVCCLALLNPGDEVLISDPGYPGTRSVISLASAVPVACAADEHLQLDITRMERLISVRTRAIIVASPNNPTGQVLSAEALNQLGMLAENYDLALIVDAAYEQLSWQPLNFKVLRPYRHRVIFIGSFSKTYAMTGWRLGWISAPRRWEAALLKTHQALVSGVAGFVQQAACTALTLPAESWRQEVKEQCEAAWQRLNAIGLSCPCPGGGFYCFPAIPANAESSEHFALQLAERAGVAVLPGALFGQSGEKHVRLSVGVRRETLQWALDQLEMFVKAGG